MIDFRPLLKQAETELQRLAKEAEKLLNDLVQQAQPVPPVDDYAARLERLSIEIDDCAVDLVAAASGRLVPDVFASVAAARSRSAVNSSSAGTWCYVDGQWKDLSVWEKHLSE